MDIPFTAVSIDADESFPRDLKEGDIPYYISRAKARAYASQLTDSQLLITSDTIVWADGKMLGKPHDETEAFAMLRSLSGKTHQVYTGVSVLSPEGRLFTGSDASEVTFCPIPEAEILAYVRSGEPMDKAGAYALQGRASLWITRLEGSYSSVIGLPLYLVRRLLLESGYRFDP